jgi:hypothetical protein
MLAEALLWAEVSAFLVFERSRRARSAQGSVSDVARCFCRDRDLNEASKKTEPLYPGLRFL